MSNNTGYDLGTLDNWSVKVVGVPNNIPPAVEISSPTDGAEFIEGLDATFTGTATDPEDGDVTSSMIWTSSLDGEIGQGASVTLNTLSVGRHQITASASDSQREQGSKTITVTVLEAVPTADFSWVHQQKYGQGSRHVQFTNLFH